MQRRLTGNRLIEVPDDDMIADVEECIVELGRMRHERKVRQKLSDDDSLNKSIRGQFDLFMRDSGKNSRDLMDDILRRWNDLHRDADIRDAVDQEKLNNILVVAAEMELQNHRGNVVAKKVVAAGV
jgi:hypothetical protein